MDLLKPTLANSCPLTPLTFLERAATVYGDCPSVVYNDTTYTWSQTQGRCLLLASSVAKMGIHRGQVVSVISPNTPAMYELHFAVPMTGAVLNTINTRLDANTFSVILRHAESKLIFVDQQYLDLVADALSIFPPNSNKPEVILIADDAHVVLPGVDQKYKVYEDLVESGDPSYEWVRPRNEWDPIVLNYTSGTTSTPKGVVHSHRSIFIMTLDSIIDWAVPKQPVYLWTLPMFHSNGWSFSWGMAVVGGTNICLRRVTPPVLYKAISEHKVTHLCGAPVVLNMLSNFPSAERVHNPVQFLTGGAPPPATVLLKAESLGFIVTHGFGMTELGSVVISCAWKPEWNRLPTMEKARLKARQGVRTIGLTDFDVIDPVTGSAVKRDGSTQGEIVVRGATLMLGYLKDPEATAKTIRDDGWLYTGDCGVMHPDGYLEIKDRYKDVIITGGENVSSVEVETVLYSHPAVYEAAVVARPDEFWGETPCGFVSLRQSSGTTILEKPTEKEVIDFCRAKLPHFMAPKTVIFKDKLPRNSTGKIQKNQLRDEAKSLGSV